MTKQQKIIKDYLDVLNEITETGAKVVNIQSIKNCFYRAFPELKESKESEDEKIIKRIIHALHGDVLDMEETTKAIEWLEKKNKQDARHKYLEELLEADTIYQMAMNDAMVEEAKAKAIEAISNMEIFELLGIEKQGEHDSIEEPKFHEGDWVVDNCGYVWKIEGILNQFYLLEDVEGGESRPTIEWVNKTFHLWTIQDARDGDVLINTNVKYPFIFKQLKPSDIKTDIKNPLTVLGYCGIGGAGFTKSEGWGDTANCTYYPATKEQRDALMKAMTDAGWKFDFDKKELKKIEQKSAEWSEKDENVTDIILSQLRSDNFSGVLGKSLLKAAESWLNSLKGRMQPKQEWSEKDEKICQETIDWFEKKCFPHALESENPARESIKWLKSLKDRYTWKPSDEQIGVIEAVINNRSFQRRHLDSLYEQLKKLREE